MQLNFHEIPTEMRAFRQWICWRYEEREGPKPTKVPYAPLSGALASVTDSSTWTSYDEAVAASINYSGIGFVLTKQDPYVIIDLDKTTNQVDLDRQIRVYEAFDSYSERSPSGDGLHIIIKADLPSGRRRSAMEIYPHERFMTMTGNVFNHKPIKEHQDLAQQVWAQMGAGAGAAVYAAESHPQLISDADVIDRALAAANGLKFAELNDGRWHGLYTSQSEADFAFIDIIVFYTLNFDQILRIFWDSPLGQRPKARRKDYVMGMVHRAFDRLLPPIDIIDKQDKLAEAIAEGKAPAFVRSTGDRSDNAMANLKKFWTKQPITPPPGLMGETMKFIYHQSPRPVHEIALAGAIGLMSGVTGRPYNISGTGLNQYVLLLAQTGTGKEAINSGIGKLINAVTQMSPTRSGVPAATSFIGPSEIASGQALLKHLSKPDQRCFVSIVGEFGLKMQQLSSPRASSSEIMLKKVLLDLYNKSGKHDVLGGSAYAQKENNTDAIFSPSVSIVGETTPSTFYSAIDERLITDGLLPRFTFIEYNGLRPPLNEDHKLVIPDDALINNLSELCARCLDLQAKGMAHEVQMTAEALEFLREVEYLTTALINATSADALRDLWNRAHIKTLKLGSQHSVGIDPYFPIIGIEAAQWAYNIISSDILTITNRFSRGEIGKNNDENLQAKIILKTCLEFVTKEWPLVAGYGDFKKLHAEKIIPHTYIQRRAGKRSLFTNDKWGGTNALKRTLQALVETGDLQEVGKGQLHTKHNFSGRAFMLANPGNLPYDLND